MMEVQQEVNMMRQAKLCVVLLILGLGGYGLPERGFAYDHTQSTNFGVLQPGDHVQFKVSPPQNAQGKDAIVTKGFYDNSDLLWFGSLAYWHSTITPEYPSSHSGHFHGEYGYPGTNGGRALTWEATTELDVVKLKHQTYASVPANRLRTKLGIGEKVQCWIEPAISVNWSVSGGGYLSADEGNSAIFTASKSRSTSTVRAQGGNINLTATFNVVPPDGMTSVFSSDESLGSPGTNNIGAKSYFRVCVLPNDVSFWWAEFRENIPGETFTWPDGTVDNSTCPAKTFEWEVNMDNTLLDKCASGFHPAMRLFNGMNYVDYTWTIRVPEEYKNEEGHWISWLPGENHPNEYRGADLKTRVKLNVSDTAFGGWMGPWE